MQPQNPYGPPQQPYNPQGHPAAGPQGPYPPGQPYPGQPQPQTPYGQPHPYGPAPGQQFHPGQPGQPPLPGTPGQPHMPGTPGQPLAPQPHIPGQAQSHPGQPMPQYQMPPNLQAPGAGGPDDLPPPPDAPATPYDFFMQPKPMPSSNPLPVGGKKLVNPTTVVKDGGNDKRKFIFFAGGAVGLLFILSIVMALMPDDPTGNQLFGIAQSQQEVIRICTDGTKKSKQRSTRNFAITCATGVTTNQRELLGYMQKQGISYNEKALGGKANSSTDSRLKTATSASTYDDTFREIMEKQLDSYNSAITQQLGLTTGPNVREVLAKSQHSAELLLKMVKDDSDKTEVAPE